MNIRNFSAGKCCGISAWPAAMVAWAVLAAGMAGYAQPAPDAAWQNLQEIVKLTQAHMTDDVIVSYIKSSGKAYTVSGDGLLYLNSQGVSQPVLAALLAASTPGAPPPAAAPGPPAMTAPPETPTMDYFQAHLTPYGQWIDVPGIGAAWVPAEANVPGWRPYMDAGHWQYTDAGWFWQSDYPWGDMAFHYGRWVNNEFTGGRWGWVPGYDWAPSWVSWREGAGGMGWAPLPWDVEFRHGLGLYWHGGAVVEGGIGFGLGFDAFVFVGSDHFWGGDYHRYAFDRERSRDFYGHSEFHAGYRMEGGHLRAEGLGREHMAAVTHHEVVEHRANEMRHAEENHNFEKRTVEHKELTHATVHTREAARPEANRGGAANEHATPAHAPETHPTSAGTHPGTTEAHGTTSHAPETHPSSPGAPGTRPGATGPNSKQPAPNSRQPPAKPKQEPPK